MKKFSTSHRTDLRPLFSPDRKGVVGFSACASILAIIFLFTPGLSRGDSMLAGTEADAAFRVGRWLKAEQSAKEFSVEYYVPNQNHRHIEVEVLETARGIRFAERCELQAMVGLFHANGSRTDVPLGGRSPNSTATGGAIGIGARIYLWEWAGMHVFADGSAQFL